MEATATQTEEDLWNTLQRAAPQLDAGWDLAQSVASLRRGTASVAGKLLPEAGIVVGGTAVSIFGKYVAEKCPPDSIVVVGEGAFGDFSAQALLERGIMATPSYRIPRVGFGEGSTPAQDVGLILPHSASGSPHRTA